MISWGLISGATAFVVGEWSFYLVRFLLGLAEAGFFPGMILFFTYWFPPIHRGRITAGFMTAIPISIALGGPISTSLLKLHGTLGLAGWQGGLTELAIRVGPRVRIRLAPAARTLGPSVISAL
jgi:MFS family permease